MADETKDCKFSLTSSVKEISSLSLTLKVPNFFILPEYGGVFYIKSPTFEFANAIWCFTFEDHKTAIRDPIRKFHVDMQRLRSKIPQHRILINITLLDTNGEKYDSFSSLALLDKNEFICDLKSFDDSASSYTRCNTLTLVINIVSGESLEEEQPILTDSGVEALSQDFKKLLLCGDKQDLILRVQNKEFKVHQDILKARCEVFAAMLNHDMVEKVKGVVDVPDCDPQAMEQFLLYVYSGKVEALSQDNAFGLYYVADKYLMPHLKEKCAKFIKQSISPSVICDVVQLALNHSDTDLLDCATEYFIKHISEILLTDEWMSFLKCNTTIANELLIKSTKKRYGNKS